MKQQIHNGVYRGVVSDINDPLNLGRCRIRVPSIHGGLEPSQIPLLPWARYVSPLPTGADKGMFIVPEVGDVVWVLFEGGNKNYPIYIGSTYGIVNGQNETPEGSGVSSEVLYRSKDVGGMKATIKTNSEGFTISFGNSFIKFNTDGSLDIHCTGKLNVSSDNEVNITGPKINLN